MFFFFCHASSSLLKFRLFFQHFVCSFIEINQFDWIKTNRCFSTYILYYIKFIYLLVENSIVNINNLKIWRPVAHTHVIFVQIFAKFLPYFFLLRIVVLELSACFKSVIVYTYLKVKWGSTPRFLSKLTVIKIKNKVTLLVAFSTNSTAIWFDCD